MGLVPLSSLRHMQLCGVGLVPTNRLYNEGSCRDDDLREDNNVSCLTVSFICLRTTSTFVGNGM